MRTENTHIVCFYFRLKKNESTTEKKRLHELDITTQVFLFVGNQRKRYHKNVNINSSLHNHITMQNIVCRWKHQKEVIKNLTNRYKKISLFSL